MYENKFEIKEGQMETSTRMMLKGYYKINIMITNDYYVNINTVNFTQ